MDEVADGDRLGRHSSALRPSLPLRAAAIFIANVGRRRGPAGRGPGYLAPNFPFVLSAATMDPIAGHGRRSSEEGIEIEEIDEG